MRIGLIIFLVAIIKTSSFAQEMPIYSHYYANPYIYNPAYVGIEGRPTLSLTHRRQWLGINDAPVTSNITFHTPIFAGFNVGFNVLQDNYGIFKTSGSLMSLGYSVPLGFNHYISFGLSGGAIFQNIDLGNININDPALVGILDKNVKLDGNAGLAYHNGGLNLGFSLQNIFNTKTFSTEQFEVGTLGLIRNYVVTADYMIYFGDNEYIFQPFGSFKSFEGYDSQYEAGGIIHLKHLLWVGGSYRQDFGIVGLLGLKLKSQFSVGYAYEMPITKASGIDKSSHEVHLSIALGKKKERAKKYATFLASQKPQKPKKKKKEPKVEEPVLEEDVTPIPIIETPLPEPKIDILDSLIEGDNNVSLLIETEDLDNTEKRDPKIISPTETVELPEAQVNIQEDLIPALVTKKGNHPFELDRGHYAVVGAFGVVANAIRENDRLLAQGYNADFGFSSDKKLFYVYIISKSTAEGARMKRDELRKLPAFNKAWYLLVE